MSNPAEVDTIDTVRTKFSNNLEKLASTIAILANDLKSKKFNVNDGNTCKSMILMGANMVSVDNLIFKFVGSTKPLWNDIFQVDASKIGPEEINKVKSHLPTELSLIINPLLDCRDKDGRLAMSSKISQTLFNYLRAFVKLGLKLIFFMQVPVSVEDKDGLYYYKYKDTSLSEKFGIDLNQELIERNVLGLPKVL